MTQATRDCQPIDQHYPLDDLSIADDATPSPGGSDSDTPT